MDRLIPSPKGFRGAVGVRYARLLTEKPSFIRREKARGAKARGVKYEEKFHRKIDELLADNSNFECLHSPWISYRDDNGSRYCQPDIVLLSKDGSFGIVHEVKYQHSLSAWFQLWRLYIPILEVLYGIRFEGCEVCKWFDCAALFPESYALTESPIVIPRRGVTAVHIWNPARD